MVPLVSVEEEEESLGRRSAKESAVEATAMYATALPSEPRLLAQRFFDDEPMPSSACGSSHKDSAASPTMVIHRTIIPPGNFISWAKAPD